METRSMKYKVILFFFSLFLLACVREPKNRFTTIHVEYKTCSSLDDSKSERHGTLTYLADTEFYYNLVTSDDVLYYRHKNEHGLLDLKSKTLFKNNVLDEAGRPSGVIESELIPPFLADTAYIRELEKDSVITLYKKKVIGDIVFIERYSNQPVYTADSSGLIESERTFLGYSRTSRKIYFQFTTLNLNLYGMAFVQTDFWKLTYSPAPTETLDDYKEQIRTAKIEQDTITHPVATDITSFVPQFSFSGLNGTPYKSVDIQQRYTLLEFWYISCAPCLKNMQGLNELYTRYKDRDVKFLVLNDADQDAERIKRVQQKSGLGYDVYYRGEQLKRALNVTAHPHTIIYDTRSSRIIYEAKGTGDEYVQEISHVLDSLLLSKKR